jgi:hypothetical protein
LKRSFINLQGVRALQQGAIDWSAHHYTFPDPKLLRQVSAFISHSLRNTRLKPARLQLVSEGIDETAVVCALQRSGNQIGRTREYLESPMIKEIFKENAAVWLSTAL